jgi:hypothetical protein
MKVRIYKDLIMSQMNIKNYIILFLLVVSAANTLPYCDFQQNVQDQLLAERTNLTNWDSLATELRKNFPSNIQFEHQDNYTEGESLYFRFYYPKIEVSKDIIFLSYIEESKNGREPITFQKIEHTIPIACIEEISSFEFTYGNTDKFDPNINYMVFYVKENCKGSKEAIFKIDSLDWMTKQPFINMEKIIEHEPMLFKFPTITEVKFKDDITVNMDKLKQVVPFLEDVLNSLKNSKIHTEQEIKKIRTYIGEGSKMEKLLKEYLTNIHPDNETLNAELTSQFRLIMQSLILYRSDIYNANYESSESSKIELNYLLHQIPSLLYRLRMLEPKDRNILWAMLKIDELNGYLQAAYGNDPPIHFTTEGINTKDVKSIRWIDVKNMTVNRGKNQVSIITTSDREIQFDFTENQYSDIASMHVHFMAFYKKMIE